MTTQRTEQGRVDQCTDLLPYPNYRNATLDDLRKDVLPNFLSRIPSRHTLRHWLDGAGVRRYKPNPFARRGGGPVQYSVADTVKFIQTRILPGGVFKRAARRQVSAQEVRSE